MTNTTTDQQPDATQAADASRSATTAATKQASSVASAAKEQASTVAHDAKDQATRLAGDARVQLRAQADQQAQRLAQTLRDIGGQLNGMAKGHGAPTGVVADVTQQAASSVHRMAQTLDDKGSDGVVADLKQFARQRPGMFVIGALGAGLIAGRLFRALDTSAVIDAAKPSQDGDTDAPAPHQDPGLPGPVSLNRPPEF